MTGNTEAMLAIALAHLLEAAEQGRPPSDSATQLAKKALETYMGPRLRDTVLRNPDGSYVVTSRSASPVPYTERAEVHPADYLPGGPLYRAARAVHPEDERVGGEPYDPDRRPGPARSPR